MQAGNVVLVSAGKGTIRPVSAALRTALRAFIPSDRKADFVKRFVNSLALTFVTSFLLSLAAVGLLRQAAAQNAAGETPINCSAPPRSTGSR